MKGYHARPELSLNGLSPGELDIIAVPVTPVGAPRGTAAPTNKISLMPMVTVLPKVVVFTAKSGATGDGLDKSCGGEESF